MSAPALILFGHGARDPDWARPMQRLRDAVLVREPQRDVRLAFLEFMTPDLAGAIDEAVAAGQRALCVAPVFLAQGGHVRHEVPLLLEQARARHPEVQIELLPALGEAQAVLDAMAGVLLAAR